MEFTFEGPDRGQRPFPQTREMSIRERRLDQY